MIKARLKPPAIGDEASALEGRFESSPSPFGGGFQKADGEQGQPTQADHDREALEQPCEIH